MAAASTIIAGAGLLTSTALSVKKTVDENKARKQAEKDIGDYERQDLTNVYAGMEIPMESFRLRQEDVQQQTSEALSTLARGGARAVVGGTGAVVSQAERASAQIGADIEESIFKLNEMIASEERRIQGATERREEADLAGLGAAAEAGRQGFYSGLGDITQNIGAAGRFVGSLTDQQNYSETSEPLTSRPLNYQPIKNPYESDYNLPDRI